MTAAKTPGQIAYETECAACPDYHDGTPRRAWADLSEHARQSWERDPTPRPWAMRHGDVANIDQERRT